VFPDADVKFFWTPARKSADADGTELKAKGSDIDLDGSPGDTDRDRQTAVVRLHRLARCRRRSDRLHDPRHHRSPEPTLSHIAKERNLKFQASNSK
jgi:hypothetical protein